MLSGMFLMGQDTWAPPPDCTADEDCEDVNICTDDACVEQACVYTNNADPCDDGEFCNGIDTCSDGVCTHPGDPCDPQCQSCNEGLGSCDNLTVACDDADVCTTDDVCSDGACSGDPLDADGDTYISDVCGGTDCNDGSAHIYPDAPEICDSVDNQCPGDLGYGDVDEGCVMVLIPAGCFQMGDGFAEGGPDERPVHEVCLSAFEMDVNEVTNAGYQACVLAGECNPPTATDLIPWDGDPITYYGNPAYDTFPVIFVDWEKADAYCRWAGKRLPTEAEWEYAARGGQSGNRYPWGDTLNCGQAAYGRYWATGECLDYDGLPNHPQEVSSYAPNGYGIYDMAGNISEWVNDLYSATYYSTSPVNDPPGPVTGFARGYRGGSWFEAASLLRTADRSSAFPSGESFNQGIRCVR